MTELYEQWKRNQTRICILPWVLRNGNFWRHAKTTISTSLKILPQSNILNDLRESLMKSNQGKTLHKTMLGKKRPQTSGFLTEKKLLLKKVFNKMERGFLAQVRLDKHVQTCLRIIVSFDQQMREKTRKSPRTPTSYHPVLFLDSMFSCTKHS